LDKEEAKEIYEKINNNLEHPLGYNFEEVCEKSMQRDLEINIGKKFYI
jgi:hypothetical protein